MTPTYENTCCCVLAEAMVWREVKLAEASSVVCTERNDTSHGHCLFAQLATKAATRLYHSSCAFLTTVGKGLDTSSASAALLKVSAYGTS